MQVQGKAQRTIWRDAEQRVFIIDQRELPHAFVTTELRTREDAFDAIADMLVRGAPLIGVTAAYGMALAMREDPSDAGLAQAGERLNDARPTAVNLRWAIERVDKHLQTIAPEAREREAFALADQMAEEDVQTNAAIGEHGAAILKEMAASKTPGEALNILTHCNAGWLATVDWGTALAPIFKATEAGLKLHVWVDETRPRNQGASLTCWELAQAGIPHTLIVDNCGGHLMQHGLVDCCIVGSDRTTARGDVCNKIGTYLKALAARDNDIPFYVALPVSTIDFTLQDGLAEIPIEERSPDEVRYMSGQTSEGTRSDVLLCPETSPAANFGFDVTPAHLVTALITEKGPCKPEAAAIAELR